MIAMYSPLSWEYLRLVPQSLRRSETQTEAQRQTSELSAAAIGRKKQRVALPKIDTDLRYHAPFGAQCVVLRRRGVVRQRNSDAQSHIRIDRFVELDMIVQRRHPNQRIFQTLLPITPRAHRHSFRNVVQRNQKTIRQTPRGMRPMIIERMIEKGIGTIIDTEAQRGENVIDGSRKPHTTLSLQCAHPTLGRHRLSLNEDDGKTKKQDKPKGKTQHKERFKQKVVKTQTKNKASREKAITLLAQNPSFAL